MLLLSPVQLLSPMLMFLSSVELHRRVTICLSSVQLPSPVPKLVSPGQLPSPVPSFCCRAVAVARADVVGVGAVAFAGADVVVGAAAVAGADVMTWSSMMLPSHVFVTAKMPVSREITTSETEIVFFIGKQTLMQCTYNLMAHGRPPPWTWHSSQEGHYIRILMYFFSGWRKVAWSGDLYLHELVFVWTCQPCIRSKCLNTSLDDT